MSNYTLNKRVDIKTGFICNNNCKFCVQADNKCKGNRSFEEIKKDLIDSKKRCDGVVLTGGEVTIRKDFLDIVTLAKNLCYKTIQIQTNGRMFSSLDFCKKTIKAGATEFSPALHGYCANQHDKLTQAKGSFNQTTQGIKNLKKLNVYVLTNTVVTKSNYKNCPEIATLLVKLNVDQFQFAFIHPMGNAFKNYYEVVPRKTLAAPYIQKGLQIGIDAGKQVMVEAMPFCFMRGYEDYIAERIMPETEIMAGHYSDKNHSTTRKTKGKEKSTKCTYCKYDCICEGPWKEYSDKSGFSEFVPIPLDNAPNNNEVQLYLKKIKEIGINVPEIVKTESNLLTFKWLPGINTETYWQKNPKEYLKLCKKIGKLQGKIHKEEITKTKKKDAKMEVINKIKRKLNTSKKTLEKHKIYVDTKKILEEKLPKQFIPDIIHGDIWFNNLIILGGRTYLIDFENVCTSFLEIDLLDNLFIHQNAFAEEYKKQNPRTKKAYKNFINNKLFYEVYYLLMSDKSIELKNKLSNI